MNLYLPSDFGDAVFVNGKPFHRVGTSPVLVSNGAEMTRPGVSDITGITSYTWNYDDSGVLNGDNHRTWTPCEMAACYLYGHRGRLPGSQPPNCIAAQNLVTVYGSVGTNLSLFESPVPCAKTDFIQHGAWTAPASGILRVLSFSGCYSGQFLTDFRGGTIERSMSLVDKKYDSGAFFSRFGFLVNGIFSRPFSKYGSSLIDALPIRVSAGDVVFPGSEGDFICDFETYNTATSGSWPVSIPLSMPWNAIFLPDSYI